MRQFILGALALSVLLAAGGCTKRVLVEDGSFDAMRPYLLSFADGSTVRGKIGLNEAVEVISEGRVYKGSIADITPDEIYLEDCRLIRSLGDEHSELIRMTLAQRNLEEDPGEFVFKLADVKQVERVKVDPLRTATRCAFWTLTGVASAFLISEKS